jgi:RHH-type proline utilization regulon transcriptional repressor/proline dehydrogenase/delta 1-pyrroline-5-carboxylate dehydrogenase
VVERHTVSTTSRRTQDRNLLPHAPPANGTFRNCQDTDFTVAANRSWIAKQLNEPSIPHPPIVDSTQAVDAIVGRALSAQAQWAMTPWQHRRQTLVQIARIMESERGRAIATMAHTTAKTVREGDPEVSEAIDFAAYAAHLTVGHEEAERAGAHWLPHRVTLVAGPWNFPYAIPAGGLVHAIAAGSAVILKPAPEAREVGALLVEQLQSAGVPEGLVQLACTPDDEVGQHLVTHDGVDLVMLTGSLDTAALFLSWKPSLLINAETSGKNAMVITAAADVDQAIKDLVKSAFGHAGQKCSAASLAIIEASVYDDPAFHERLADAVRSLTVGDATRLATMVGPLIAPPRGNLERALTTLEPGESWLVQPRPLEGCSWAPGVRKDVMPGSWFHLTECFGPVLGLMRARDLDDAIDLQNAPAYGLTGGIESLDPQEIDHWLARVEVGNAYVNRHITGAIVQRQPFGGWKASSVGPGSKPGGPHHLSSYGTWTTSGREESGGAPSYERSWQARFRFGRDASGLASESNILRYVPLDRVVARVSSTRGREADMLRAAATTTGVPLEFSVLDEESDEALGARLARLPGATVLRLLAPAADCVLSSALASSVTVDRAPVTVLGDLELPHWLKEQAISRTMHRYGRLLAPTP